MRPLGAAEQHPDAGVLLPSTVDGFSDSVLGDLIAYAKCEQIPGSDAPMTCRLGSLICPTSLRFRLCWLRGRPLVRGTGPLLWPIVWTLLGRGNLTRSPLLWVRRTALCLRRDCLAGRITSHNGPI